MSRWPRRLTCAARCDGRTEEHAGQPVVLRGDRAKAKPLRALPYCFCQKERLSDMVRIDALAASVRFAYCTTSRSTRVAWDRSADHIRASGHGGCIAKEAILQAKTGRIHDCTRTLRRYVRFLLHRGRRPYMTHQRHWLCTAAKVLMPGLSPFKVLV